MELKILFMVSLISYLLLSAYLTIAALSEKPIKRSKLIIALVALAASIYGVCYYLEMLA